MWGQGESEWEGVGRAQAPDCRQEGGGQEVGRDGRVQMPGIRPLDSPIACPPLPASPTAICSTAMVGQDKFKMTLRQLDSIKGKL